MTPALIQRVESATGEDRHLDAYIFAAFHREPVEPSQTWSVMDSFQFRFTDGRKNALYVHEDDVPAYSASLDAAVSLCERVLPDANWMVMRRAYDEGVYQGGKAGAFLHSKPTSSAMFDTKAFHFTPALALVLAVLRAVTP